MNSSNKIKSSIGIFLLLTSTLMSALPPISSMKSATYCEALEIINLNNKKEKLPFCINIKTIIPLIDNENKKLQKSVREFIDKPLLQYDKDYMLTVVNKAANYNIVARNHVINSTVSIFSGSLDTLSLKRKTLKDTGTPYAEEETGFINYHRDTGKELSLDDLFIKGYETKLLELAEDEYRRQENLKSSDSLVKLGWLKNEFKLAKNIAIANDGLLLNYTVNEVSSTEHSLPSFTIPYQLLRNIIPLDSYLDWFFHIRK